MLPSLLLALLSPSFGAQSSAIELTEVSVGELVFTARTVGPEDGQPVLLLHGFPQTSFSFRHQMAALAEAGFHAVAPDQRGYSPGARPEGVASYAMQHLVADVIGIADALGFERFHLVGHDWGGAVAWVVAARHPDRLRTLSVLSTPHYAAFSRTRGDPASGQAERSSYMLRFAEQGSEQDFLKDDAAGLRQIFSGAGLSSDEVQAYVDVLGTPQAMRSALNWYSALLSGAASTPAASTTALAPVPQIRVPTLYVWGTQDGAFGRDAAEMTGEFVAEPFRFEVFEGIGHWIPEQAAERMNKLLLTHIRER